MKLIYLCDQHNPMCENSYCCGVECCQTDDPEHSIGGAPPTSLEDLEERFEYVGDLVLNGRRETVWEEIRRRETYS